MYQTLSLWHDTAGDDFVPRPPLEGSTQADVAIIGAGFTGLWTAYYLATLQPDLKVVLLEAEVAGFGASGRNGGWATGEIAGNRRRMAQRHGKEPVQRLLRLMFDAVDEIAKVTAGEGIECQFAKGGILTFATNNAQFVRLQHELQHQRSWGLGEDDYRWLGPQEIDAVAQVAGSQGALYTPHAAAIHPARLVRGLARAVEAKGVAIFEGTRVEALEPGLVSARGGTVSAGVVLRCTEAFTRDLPGERRTYLPIYSLMVATEPLGVDFWDQMGFHRREVFNDARHLVIYGQRTADGRLAFGGRGGRYHFGSAVNASLDRQPRVHDAVAAILRSLFPGTADARITHAWGGAVAIPRDWRPAVVFDRLRGMGYAGGYVGEGVVASNLAARTLVDLVLSRESPLIGLPWTQHRARKWEPEPIRFLGVNAAIRLAPLADRMEAGTGRPSRFLGGMLDTLTGR
ncbi:MAG TPA: FAD-binding oxidoreductase [Acidimicrobiia bacterium]|nr:FAD-binding oxidoreductase [Acidimicrobiia bacterium]